MISLEFRGQILNLGDAHSMLMVKSIRLTENMVTFVKKRISLWIAGKDATRRRLSIRRTR